MYLSSDLKNFVIIILNRNYCYYQRDFNGFIREITTYKHLNFWKNYTDDIKVQNAVKAFCENKVKKNIELLKSNLKKLLF